MKWANIWELTKINILYSNPQILEAIKKKRAKKPEGRFSAYKSMIRQQMVGMVIMLVVYSYFFIGIDYRYMPGMFTVQLTMFMIVSLVYGFTSFFAIFYDSNDTKLYLPLPLKAGEVYLAKLLSAQGSILTYLAPIIPLLGICYWQLTGSALGLLWVLPMVLLIVIFINLVGLTLIHFIGELLVRSPYKKTISATLMTVSMILAIGIILFVQFSSQNQMLSENPTDMPNIFLLRGFYDIVVNPFSPETFLNFGFTLLLVAALFLYVWRQVVPSYFRQILAMEHVQSKKKVKKAGAVKNLTLQQTLRKHHLSTLTDGTLIVQSYIMPLLYSFIFIGPITNGEFSFTDIPSEFFGVAFLVGFIFGVFFGSPNSFVGVAISLERENYTFLKTLPIHFKSFLVDKFLLICLVQHGLPFAVYLLMLLFFLKPPLILTLFFLLGVLVAAMLASQAVYWRDYRLLSLNWQNVSQLFSRGKSNLLVALGTFGLMIVGSLLTLATVMLALYTNALLVNLGILFLLVALAAGLQVWIYRGFWKKL